MKTPSKIIIALALAGFAVAGGAAFTASGVSATGQAGQIQFVGGQVTQTVSDGVVLNDVKYTYSDPANTTVSKIQLTFAAALPDTVNVTATSGSGTTPVLIIKTGGDALGTFSPDSGHMVYTLDGTTGGLTPSANVNVLNVIVSPLHVGA